LAADAGWAFGESIAGLGAGSQADSAEFFEALVEPAPVAAEVVVAGVPESQDGVVCGTMRRTGKPCSGARGSSFRRVANNEPLEVRSSTVSVAL
jgi:hypothetical protein